MLLGPAHLHQAIIEGGDLNFPFTLGLCREGPCRALARTAVSRFEGLGIRTHATTEAVQVATSLYFISRSKLILSCDRSR